MPGQSARIPQQLRRLYAVCGSCVSSSSDNRVGAGTTVAPVWRVHYEEKPDPIGRTLLNGVMVWGAVGCVVWVTLQVVFGDGSHKAIPRDEVIPDVARAKDLFEKRCVPCHGSTGHGDGPNAVNLTPKPRKFADGAWQDSVTDDQIEATILLGGETMGKSPLMAANPDLQHDPALLQGLRVVVRGFKQSKAM